MKRHVLDQIFNEHKVNVKRSIEYLNNGKIEIRK